MWIYLPIDKVQYYTVDTYSLLLIKSCKIENKGTKATEENIFPSMLSNFKLPHRPFL